MQPSNAECLLWLQEVKGGGNIFDKIGSWFSDRKDDASHTADKVADKVKK